MSLFLEKEPDFKITGKCAGVFATLSLAVSLQPDVMVMDINMPCMNGIGATTRRAVKYPIIKTVTLSSTVEELYVQKMFVAGASGYVLQQNAANELIPTLYSAMKEQKSFV